MQQLSEAGLNYQFVKVNEACNQMLDVMKEHSNSDLFNVVEVKDSRNFGFHTLAYIFSQIQKITKVIENERMQVM